MNKCKPAVEILLSLDPLVYSYGFFLPPWFRFFLCSSRGEGQAYARISPTAIYILGILEFFQIVLLHVKMVYFTSTCIARL